MKEGEEEPFQTKDRSLVIENIIIDYYYEEEQEEVEVEEEAPFQIGDSQLDITNIIYGQYNEKRKNIIHFGANMCPSQTSLPYQNYNNYEENQQIIEEEYKILIVENGTINPKQYYHDQHSIIPYSQSSTQIVPQTFNQLSVHDYNTIQYNNKREAKVIIGHHASKNIQKSNLNQLNPYKRQIRRKMKYLNRGVKASHNKIILRYNHPSIH